GVALHDDEGDAEAREVGREAARLVEGADDGREARAVQAGQEAEHDPLEAAHVEGEHDVGDLDCAVPGHHVSGSIARPPPRAAPWDRTLRAPGSPRRPRRLPLTLPGRYRPAPPPMSHEEPTHPTANDTTHVEEAVHSPRPSDSPSRHAEDRSNSAFRKVPRTGVIYVMGEATRHGYRHGGEPGEDGWCNLGQGQPETGPLPGSPPRVEGLTIALDDQEYAPVAGLWELREAIADFYNRAYRRGMPSRYTAENVAVSGGGRIALTRAAAALGNVNLGHFLPDYTAYEELLDVFRLFSPIPILLEAERGYAFSVGDLRREILGRGLSAILSSNPCNPTGKHIRGEELAA